ncbi:2'-5' RNA ligase family protein [Saccharopolyspora griseoalba]|uniref:2'-5' RNA ligase family protein n=1 Tax=Saccharopolyspora griseoalba TaxID=1431848 RepID=A0ABW2LV22_9PSEU
MRSFDDAERWSPAGRRWIAQIRLTSTEVLDLGDTYLAAARAWWPEIDQVLRPVQRAYRHITLINTNVPAETAPAELVEQLSARLAVTAAAHLPVQLMLGPAVVNTLAVELYIQPSPALTALRDALATDVAAVLERPAEPQGKTWRAHSAISYCTAPFDDDGLQSTLLRTPGLVAGYQGPVRERVDRVLLAATDPWDPNGRFWTDSVELQLGSR